MLATFFYLLLNIIFVLIKMHQTICLYVQSTGTESIKIVVSNVAPVAYTKLINLLAFL